MAFKYLLKKFNNWQGVDLNANPITRAPEYCEKATNIQFSEQEDLELRRGFQLIDRKAAGPVEIPCPGPGRLGLGRYTYLDNLSGETKVEIVGFEQESIPLSTGQNSGLFTLATATFLVNGPANSTYSITQDSSNGSFQCELKTAGVVVFTVGLGFPLSTTSTIENLRSAINTFGGGFSCVITPYATAAASGAALGNTADIQLTAGHSFSANVPVYPESTTVALRRLKASSVIGNNMRWVDSADRTITAGDVFGPARLTCNHLEKVVDRPVGQSSLIRYWRSVYADMQFGYSVALNYNQPNQRNYSFQSLSDCLFVSQSSTVNTGVACYDSQRIYRTGLPAPAALSAPTPVAGAGYTAGRYRMIAVYQYIDKQGNIITSEPSPVLEFTSAGVTSYQVTLPVTGLVNFPSACAQLTTGSGAQTSATTFTVAFNLAAHVGPSLRPGDPLFMFDSVFRKVVQATVLNTRYTGAATREITLSLSGAITVNSGVWPIFSSGLTCIVYRTKANGTSFFRAFEVPISGNISGSGYTPNFTDTTTDANLGEEYIPNPAGFEHDPPPTLGVLCSHQGLLVGSGGTDAPNQVLWSSAEGPWYFPAATNSTDVPSQELGIISAMGSDDVNRLAVFKPSAIYELVGNLADLSFNVETITEGDIGCTSHAALVKCKDSLIFPSTVGFQRLRGGQLEEGFNARLKSRFKNVDGDIVPNPSTTVTSTRLQLARAIAVNDVKENRYVCFIPSEDVSRGVTFPTDAKIYVNGNSECWVYDYERDTWTDWKFKDPINSNFGGGMVYFDNKIYATTRAQNNTNTLIQSYLQTDDDYYDVEQPIDCEFIDSHYLLGEPSIMKTPLRVRLWKFITGSTFTFTFLEDFRDYLPAISANAWTSTPVSFGSTPNTFNAISQDIELKSGKGLSWQLKLRNTDGTTSYRGKYWGLSGYEVVIAATSEKEDLQK